MRPRLLYLTHRVPFPPDKGDRIRNYHLLRQLSHRFRVSLGCLADEPVSDETHRELRGLCEQVAVVPQSRFGRLAGAGRSFLTGGSLSEGAFSNRELARTAEAWHAQSPFATAVVSATSLIPYLRRPALRGVPAFVDVVDVDSRKWDDFAATARFPKSLLFRLEGSRVRKLEADLPKWAAAASLVSRAEADIFEEVAGRGTATVATNGVDLDYFQPTPTPVKPVAAFVGALDYLPNVDAAVWFAREVWPAIHQSRPDAEFWLIGRKPTAEVRTLADLPGVKLIGQVPDVRPHLAEAAVAVVPMRLSRGLQNKVLEALAMGKATVVAPPALAALKAEPGRHLLKATTPDEWAAAVLALLGDAAHREQLGRAGRTFVEEHHHWDRCLQPLVEKIAAACETKTPQMVEV
ncbi:TIGR03087 family PEP-CTERM/XrtA system glycosyltransferase [Limnoglobus roseus]|uniref:GT4 family glycosyltransferase n=1 Tax=Limnoglobus roseus TaxID=2598579 RepID=A0A5C1AJA5_9BACT|nr:TIGR03087 family PEP-CTERM/XrtA system glycosyltransferase [Limnoglobus roseus]QEL17214.1 GT4 family glycosyltransferase [Limnoglobus roseus]